MILDKNVISTKTHFVFSRFPAKRQRPLFLFGEQMPKDKHHNFACKVQNLESPSYQYIVSMIFIVYASKTDKLKGLEYKALRKPFDMCDKILGPPQGEKIFGCPDSLQNPKSSFAFGEKCQRTKITILLARKTQCLHNELGHVQHLASPFYQYIVLALFIVNASKLKHVVSCFGKQFKISKQPIIGFRLCVLCTNMYCLAFLCKR